MRVLVVDDDEAVRSALTHALHRDGYEVSTAGDGAAALATLLRLRHDAVVLDVLMPEPGGLEVCRVIRARGDDTPILMLTARDLVSDRVAGLDAGADDYLAKPFALEELRARLRALLRRSGAGAGLLRFAGIELDVAAHQASRGGMKLQLTKTEFALLELFLRNPGAGAAVRARFPADAGPRRSGRAGTGDRQPGRQRAEWSPPDGRIRISAAGGRVEVSDDGPGIPAEDLPYVFDRFYRSAQARALPGSGLGLAIVRRIADVHHGTVEAIPLRHGVKFRISVPETVDDRLG